MCSVIAFCSAQTVDADSYEITLLNGTTDLQDGTAQYIQANQQPLTVLFNNNIG